ncbi:hypothetical protein C0J52_20248 [Blattella germanica]|nr:hypothetical protein C0J52_20248 [Blattella germanica]
MTHALNVCVWVGRSEMGTFYHFVREQQMLGIVEDALTKRSMNLNLSYFEMEEVPEQLTGLADVRKVYLHNNKLVVLPEALSRLQNLHTLTLDYNELTTLPHGIGTLKQLVCLNVSYNPLKELSTEIGDLCSLEVLWLNHTQLKFLPPDIGKLRNLDTFGARGNNISTLPEEMGTLDKLSQGQENKDVRKSVGSLLMSSMEVSRLEQRAYIKIAVLRGQNAREFHAQLLEAVGARALPYRTVARWVAAFESGREATKDKPRTGRPRTVRTDVYRAVIQQCLENGRRWSLQELDNGAADGITRLPHRWQRTVDCLGDYFEGC